MLGQGGSDNDHERLKRPLVPRAIEVPDERVGSKGLGLRGPERRACDAGRHLVRVAGCRLAEPRSGCPPEYRPKAPHLTPSPGLNYRATPGTRSEQRTNIRAHSGLRQGYFPIASPGTNCHISLSLRQAKQEL